MTNTSTGPRPPLTHRKRRLHRAIFSAVAVGALVLTVAFVADRMDRSAAPTPQPPVAVSPTSPVPASDTPFTVSGRQLLRGDVPWWLVGYNSFTWSGECGRPDELMTEQQVDEWFASMRHDGHGAVRLMFFDGWSFERLDAALAAAARNNVYVTITLDNGLANCGEEEKTTEWFQSSDQRAAYAAHMTDLLTRYRGNNSIAWFEYFNEPSFADGALRTFYDEMGALADTVDPDRLFSSGTLAPYALGGEENFATVQNSPGVDIASLHEYDYNEAESHLGPQVRANSAGKPVIVGEFGVIDPTTHAQACLADANQRVKRVQDKLSAYRGDGYVGAFAWAWQPGHPEDVCGSPGLDRDQAVQQVIRTAPPP